MSFPSEKFNLEQIRQISEGDHEFEDDLMESYKTELEELLVKLEPELKLGQNHADCVRLAHDIKGSSANVGAEGVREVGKVMEELARDGKYDEVLVLLPKVRQEFDEFCLIWDDYKRTW
jgi:HPt (histidine-containing phosphotransfer) domain-containing protein